MSDLIESTLGWLQGASFSVAIRESDWMFPTVETVHVIALAIVVGSILVVDCRLIGIASRTKPYSSLAREMLPWTWSAFAVASVAGFAMFSSKALTYAANMPFRLKMLLLLLAGINMLVFQAIGSRQLASQDSNEPSVGGRFAGGASIVLWIGVVATGRWIGFTT